MSRIDIPSKTDLAPEASRPLLQQVTKLLGSAPNLFRLVANSPAALEGYLGIFGALGKGKLPSPTRERIALAIAEYNGCNYCLSAHTYLAKNVAKFSDEEIVANRNGRSYDAKAEAAVVFALKVAENRGRVKDEDLAAVRQAGYSDELVIEIVQHVALNIWTNYMNEVAQTEIDFPVASRLVA